MRFKTPLVGFVLAVGACAPGEDPPTTGDVIITMDVVYGRKFGMALTFDVYQPVRPNGAGVVLLNSGGWVSPFFAVHVVEDGEARLLELSDPPQFSARLLVENGFTVFNLRHGSAPKFVVPEAVQDVRLGLRVIKASAADFGVDPNRIGLWGGSAGGHLSLLLGTASEVGPQPQAPEPARVAAIVAFYPVAELESERVAAGRYTEEVRGVDLFTAFPALDYPTELDSELSPVRFATADDPPTLLIHGDQDRLVPLRQGEIMRDALSRAGVVVELVILEGAEHGFAGPDLEIALERTLSWFERHLN